MELKRIKRKLTDEEKIIITNASNIIGEPLILFDIETTGFDRKFSNISVIGALYWDSQKDYVELFQFFSESKGDEINVIREFHNFLSDDSILITFNGNSFDIPYINSKSQQFSLKSNLLAYPKLDLYSLAKSVFSDSKTLSLKAVEKKLGITRTDIISGLEAANLYKEYLSNPSKIIKDKILLHNEDDIFNMIGLLKLIDINKTFLTPLAVNPIGIISNIIIKTNILSMEIHLKSSTHLSESINCISTYNVDYLGDYTNNKLEIKIPLTKENGILIVDSIELFNLSFKELKDEFRTLLIIKNIETKEIYFDNIKELTYLLLNSPKGFESE